MFSLRHLLLLSSATLPCISPAETHYRVIDIGDFPGGYDASAAWAISSDGRVAGYGTSALNRAHQLYWDQKTGRIEIPTIGGVPGFGYAYGVNSSGLVVGENLANGQLNATVWDPVNGIRALPGLPGSFEIAQAFAVNDAGQVVGASQTPIDFHACLWNTFATVEDLGVLPGDTRSMAYGIGPDGTVVGFSKAVSEQAFLWRPGSGLYSIGQFQPGFDCEAWGVNTIGQVTGCSNGQPQRGFIWSEANGWADLGDGPLGVTVQAYSINAVGQVVGDYSGSLGTHGFVWSQATGVLDLDDMLTPDSVQWTVTDAAAVNDKGWIAGTAKTSVITRGHAVLLKPVYGVAPSDMIVRLGRLTAGSVADLAYDDGVALQVCKFLVPSQTSPIVRIEFLGTSPVSAVTAFKLTVKSAMATAGAFRQDLALFDYVSGTYTDMRQDGLGTNYQTVDLVATQPANMVGSNREVNARLEIYQTGPSAAGRPCANFDLVKWSVED